ncbi:hypothetical protein Trydic_g6466 [Trypoxylus dichotomus]
MAQINGKYRCIKSENMKEFLEAQGITLNEDRIRRLDSGTITINLDCNQCSITYDNGTDSHLSNFRFGESFEEDFGTTKFQSIASLDGEKIAITSKANGNGNESVRTYQLMDNVCKITHSSPSNDVIAYRYFERI